MIDRPIAFLLGAAALLLGFGACVQAAEATSYTQDGLACVDKNATRALADACRCDVEKKYHRPLVHCASDAGRDAP